MTVLSVNLNKIALLRNAREGQRPSVLQAARDAIAEGAKGITVHPRPDQRHIRPDDVTALAALLKSDYPGIEFNIEGNPFATATEAGYPGFDALIANTRPAQATLVPDSDDQLTSDHGWDLSTPNAALQGKIEQYHNFGARVSLFMEPVAEHIHAAKAHGADRIEFYTGPYAETFWADGAEAASTQASFKRFCDAAELAAELGLGINAGHDLDQSNLLLFRRLPHLLEVSIGHAIICEGLEAGFRPTVAAYVNLLES